MTESRRRNHPYWIEQYANYTDYSNSPRIYRKWAALSAISAVLQRKVFCILNGGTIFPNLFVALVGPPGLGKTLAISPVRNMLARIETVKLSPAKLSAEKFIGLLSKTTRIIPLEKDPFFSQSAYAVFLSELSTFIRPNDIDFMTVLTDLYDCPTSWTYATIARDSERLENVFLSILGGITPKALAANFGSASIGMGFTARVNMIFSEDFKAPDLFGVQELPDMQTYQEDLQHMATLSGCFKFSRETMEEFQSWVSSGMAPIPSDGKLQEYLPRRWLHLAKLCMIYSIAESDRLFIELHHYKKAKQTLLEAEAVLHQALEYMGSSNVIEALRNVHSWMMAEYNKTKSAISETKLKHKLLFDVPPQNLNSTIIELVSSGYATVVGTGPDRKYIPVLMK
jgi:hypothetical protein